MTNVVTIRLSESMFISQWLIVNDYMHCIIYSVYSSINIHCYWVEQSSKNASNILKELKNRFFLTKIFFIKNCFYISSASKV